MSDQDVIEQSESDARGSLKQLVRKPRNKWFSAPERSCPDGWYGPHETIEAAVMECASNYGTREPIYVGQGRKLTKSELADGYDYAWEVDAPNAIEVRLPNEKGQR